MVTFKSWESQVAFYKPCPKHFMNGRKKPAVKNFSVSLDPTKRHYTLLTKDKGLVNDNHSVAYALKNKLWHKLFSCIKNKWQQVQVI